MPSFPIPIFVACVLAFAALRLWQQRNYPSLLIVLLVLCAVQSLIIALSQHYGVAGLRLVQPITATLIPPAAWIAYKGWARSDVLHILAPLAALAALLTAPQFLDVLLPALFVVYGGLIFYNAKQGADNQPDALLSSGDIPSQIWIVIGIALMASALSDLLIVAAQASGYSGLRPWIISVFSVGNLLVIGILSFSPHLQTRPDDIASEEIESPEPDADIWAQLQDFMIAKKPFLDPDLTLSRLSRQMGIPAKKLSTTINLATGNNVSRFINQARIAMAQKDMLAGTSVTHAMLASGFNTKSNFNREFLRIVGKSPTAWLSEQTSS